MSEPFTEVTHEGWFSRLGNAIVGVVIGILLFLAAFPVLFWNEGNSVRTFKSLAEGEKAVVEGDLAKVDASLEGKLVHLTGLADPQGTLADPQFGVSRKAVLLSRVVEMHQWKERKESKSEKTVGGGKETVTKYYYDKAWAKDPINSDSFKTAQNPPNPKTIPFPSQAWKATEVRFGAFKLSPGQIDDIRWTEKLPVSEEDLRRMDGPSAAGLKVDGGAFYKGAGSQAAPQIGDVRVGFEIVPPGEISVVARQTGSSFTGFPTAAGKELSFVMKGARTATEMFEQKKQEAALMTWILRLVGFAMMAIGLGMTLKPLSVAADVIPFVGNLVEMGTGLVAGLVALAFSLMTIGVAWLFYRPLLGVPLLLAAGGLIWLVKSRSSAKGEAKRAAAAQAAGQQMFPAMPGMAGQQQPGSGQV